MRYLLDADVFIEANNTRYRPGEFPSIWDWIAEKAHAGTVTSVVAVRRELHDQQLLEWIDSELPEHFFRRETGEESAMTTQIANDIDQNAQYRDEAKADFMDGADVSLIAHAKAHDFVVVTYEVSAPNSRKTIKIPDVATKLDVETMPLHDLFRAEGARF